MKSAIVFALLLTWVAASAGAQQSAIAQPAPFQWNWKDLQVLGGQDRVSQLKSLSPMERDRILDALVQQLKPGKEETGTQTPAEWHAEAAETRIRLVDLNGDGVPEVIAQATAGCGATGNCAFWVFMRSGPAYKLILKANAIESFAILRSKTSGFFDLVLEAQISATEQGLSVYRFINGRYRRGACYDANWQRLVNGEVQDLKEPVITPCGR